MRPEGQAREQIDEQLQASGWVAQSRVETNLGAARGVAVGEFPLTTGFADYMLFVDRRPIGVVKANVIFFDRKPASETRGPRRCGFTICART